MMSGNKKTIIIYNQEYRREAYIVGNKISNVEDVIFQEMNFRFIPYCQNNILYYDMDKKGRFDRIIILFPLCDYECEDVYKHISSIETSDNLVLMISVLDKRYRGSSLHSRLQELYSKAYLTDANRMLDKGRMFSDRLSNHNRYVFTDKYGSHLQFSRDSDISIDVFHGQSSGVYQLPGGEVFFALSPNGANGTLYLQGDRYIVENNVLHATSVDTKHDGLVICEFGLGVNDKIPPCPQLDIAEKSYGTCHFGFGSNLNFGGNIDASYHFDIIFRGFALYGDGRLLVEFD